MSQNSAPFHPSPSLLWPLLLLIGANALVIAPAPPGLRYVAALTLLAFLPGWVWLQVVLAPPPRNDEPKTPSRLDLLERLTLAVGLSLALTIVAAMFAVYLPGALSLSPLLLTIDIFILTGWVLLWRQQRLTFHASPITPHPSPLPPNTLALITLLTLLLLAAALRLPRLGYAEFHEDEAEALMLGVRLLQGEDYALFLHRKGPAQMLVPLAFWLLTGHINEALARFPFALSSILSVAALFFMGRRWFGWPAGAIAGLLWAANGYAIAFGRMVQYQALIFFLGPLGLYCLYLAVWEGGKSGGREGGRMGGWQVVGATLLAVCLLAHFDALLLLPAAAYLGWVTMSRGAEEQRGRGEEGSPLLPCSPAPLLGSRFATGALALALFVALLASFYIPYVLDPEFKNTAGYLAGSRVKPGLLYNNLDLLRRLDQDYSSRFYLPLLMVGIASFALWPILKGLGVMDFRSCLKNWSARLALPGKPGFALQSKPLFRQFLGSAARLKFRVETLAAWLMFGAGFIGYVFLVEDPRTHLYILYPGAVLLVGAAFDFGFSIFDFRFFLIRILISLFIATMASLVVFYEVVIFLQTEPALDQLRQHWEGSIWETVYADLPKPRAYFGYPKREGWKAVGALRAQGLFRGDFRSINEDFIIPIWYTYGQARSCYDTPAQFFVRAAGSDIYIPEENIQKYNEVGWIEREGEVRLRIFSAKNLPGSSATAGQVMTTPAVYRLEDLGDDFDQLATPRRFVQQAEPTHPVTTQFGPAIQFLGFDLPQTTVAPGETLQVNLYWRALQPPGNHYRAFVHLTDGANLWGQQDDDPACRLPTSIWRAGQRGLGQFRLPLKPETPPGRYPLIIGLYQADTLERLKITAGAGQVGDDFLWLGDIEVRER